MIENEQNKMSPEGYRTLSIAQYSEIDVLKLQLLETYFIKELKVKVEFMTWSKNLENLTVLVTIKWINFADVKVWFIDN